MRVKSVMVLRPVVRSLRLAPIAAALGLLAACASSAGSRPSAPVNALYGQLDQASKGYETALQQSRAGDLEASQLTLTRSLDQLKAASAQCGNTPGCDPQRFFSVFDHLLRLKDGDFDDGQDLNSDVDPSQAALAAGKTGAASLPEALGSGVPVLATPVGMVPDFVHDGQNGLILTGNANRDGARIMALLDPLSSDTGYAQLADGAFHGAPGIPSWEDVMRQWMDMYAA